MDVARQKIRGFLEHGPYAVVGASRDRSKYGNRVVRAMQQNGLKLYPVNPHETEIEGLTCYPDLQSLPEPVWGASIVTPPEVTEKIVQQAADAGIRYVWMQPGAESLAAIQRAEELGLAVIAGGPCLLVTLQYHE
jgi:uncharacterized protein